VFWECPSWSLFWNAESWKLTENIGKEEVSRSMDSRILKMVVGVQLLVRQEYSRAGWALLFQKEERLYLQNRINWKAENSGTKDIWH
jgi:hypothetical protein